MRVEMMKSKSLAGVAAVVVLKGAVTAGLILLAKTASAQVVSGLDATDAAQRKQVKSIVCKPYRVDADTKVLEADLTLNEKENLYDFHFVEAKKSSEGWFKGMNCTFGQDDDRVVECARAGTEAELKQSLIPAALVHFSVSKISTILFRQEEKMVTVNLSFHPSGLSDGTAGSIDQDFSDFECDVKPVGEPGFSTI
jgi:hypothetical protein